MGEGIEIPRLDLTEELNLEHGDFEFCHFTCRILVTLVVNGKGGVGERIGTTNEKGCTLC